MSSIESQQHDIRALDDLLVAYSAGSLDPARQALVASHLLLNPQNRRFVRAIENTVASELALDPGSASVARRETRLAAIFDAADAPPVEREPWGEQVLPTPLRRFMGCSLDDVSWSFVVPGVRECRLGDVGRGSISLLRVKAGRRLPQHTHEGSEITLVLAGAFTDPLGRYGRGDIAIADSEIDHSPVVESEEECICFAITDAPLVLTGPFGRVVQKIFGRTH
ncbi:MAG: ChrR family anti-sigma-E factor [Beijerinckiaceae bacterium]|nr:ChrR family anti-sigma-E factor [Beijerinckiaceae bacterium]